MVENDILVWLEKSIAEYEIESKKVKNNEAYYRGAIHAFKNTEIEIMRRVKQYDIKLTNALAENKALLTKIKDLTK